MTIDVGLKPTKSVELFKGIATVHAFGRETGNWRIGDFTKPENFRRVAELAQKFGVDTVWCPQASKFNATIAKPISFGPCDLDDNYQHEIAGIKVMRGTEASGCVVSKGEAFFMATADCPIMVVRNTIGKIVCAHAGRGELIDPAWVENGRPNYHRRFESVVDAIVSYFGSCIKQLEIASVFGIRHGHIHSVNDPKYGDFNLKLRQYIQERWGAEIICFSRDEEFLIQRLIGLQWRSRHSIDDRQIWCDEVCTKTDIDNENNFRWHSVARGDNKGERNGIFVIVNK